MFILGSFLGFPQSTRPYIKRMGHLSTFFTYLICAMLFALGSAIVYMERDNTRTLWQDWRLRHHYQPVPEAEVHPESYCWQSRSISTCRIFIYHQDRFIKQKTVFFGSRPKALPPLQLLSDGGNPPRFSNSFAMEKLGSRSLAWLFFHATGFVLIGITLFTLFLWLPWKRRRLAALYAWQGQPWLLVGLEDFHHTKKRYIVNIPRKNPKKKPYRLLIEGKYFSPYLFEHQGNAYLLAVMPKNGGMPVPLDLNLEIVGGLTESQRRQCRRHIEALIQAENHSENP